MEAPLNILMVATKPPWPPVDGGRVVMLQTIDALASAGHRLTVVSPADRDADDDRIRQQLANRCRIELVSERPRSARRVLVTSIVGRRPVTVVRHDLARVRQRVAELVDTDAFDVVQAEQVQAIPQTSPATGRGIPLVYRAHNVESALWTFAAAFGRSVTAGLLRREAKRLAVWERTVVQHASATVVLTDVDVAPLRLAVGDGPLIEKVPVPYPETLPAGEIPLEGRPAVVTLTSQTWLPSRETARQVAEVWWPVVRERLPDAVLHVFGAGPDMGDCDGVRIHPPPEESVEAFAAGGIVAIPTRHPTGVPVKGLEAWSRGLPLVVSSEAAEAIEGSDGVDLVTADTPEELVTGLAALADDGALRERIVAGGRKRLRTQHDPARIADQLTDLYRRVISRS